jgi:hypothetical protein
VFPAIIALQEKVKKLEKDSHPPVQFEECPDCHCMVAPGRMLEHQGIHPDPMIGPDGEDYN